MVSVSPLDGETLSRPPSFSVTPLALMSMVCLNFILAFVANSNKIKLLAFVSDLSGVVWFNFIYDSLID